MADPDLNSARQGDAAAFARLVERFAPALFRFARRLSRDDAEAEDVVQEVLLRVHGALSRYDPARPFAPWLFRIASNVAVSRARARRRRPAGALGLADPAAPGPDAAGRAAAADEAAAVRRAVDELPPRYRALVALFYLDEMDLADAAEALAIPIGTAKVRLFRARALLRARLSPGGETRRGGAA